MLLAYGLLKLQHIILKSLFWFNIENERIGSAGRKG